MRKQVRIALIGAILAAGAAFAHADGIGPGSPAPAMDVKTWYKGKPVTKFDKNKVYVVEFWATWCGPCRESIPHLTEIAKKNQDVTFAGISIWEDDKGDNIKNFVAQMGDKMDYNVGYSGNKEGMSQTWMTAAGQNGIPTAFIIKNNTVQWIGHPMELEKPLEEVKSGKFNLAKFKAEFNKQADANRAMMAAQKEIETISQLIKDGKYDDATKKLNELEKKSPMLKEQADSLRFTMLAKTDPTKWDAKAKEMASSGNEQSVMQLCIFALNQFEEKGDAAMGQKAMDYALSSAKDGDLMTYYYGAMFYDQKKDPKKALELVDKAIAALPKSKFKDSKQAQEALSKMREDFAKKAG